MFTGSSRGRGPRSGARGSLEDRVLEDHALEDPEEERATTIDPLVDAFAGQFMESAFRGELWTLSENVADPDEIDGLLLDLPAQSPAEEADEDEEEY